MTEDEQAQAEENVEDLFERILSDDAHLGELHLAVHVNGDRPELTEEWFVLYDRDGSNARLGAVHRLFLPEEAENELQELQEKYGDQVVATGYTYAAGATYLGVKYFNPETEKALRIMAEAECSRAYLMDIFLKNYIRDNGEEKARQVEQVVGAIEDEEFNELIKDMKEEVISRNLRVMTQEEAQQAYMAFIELDEDGERQVREQDIRYIEGKKARARRRLGLLPE
jgi:hypothetical protein